MSVENDPRIFCRNVCRLREEAGFSLAELARRSGVPLKMLEALAQDVLPPKMDVDHALHLAKALGCEIWEFF